MNKVLEFVMTYLLYLVTVFLGLWVGKLLIGLDFNPFTSWVPYVMPLVIILSEYISK